MPSDQGLKILIAEDNQAMVALLFKFLQKQGHTLLPANDGQTALELFENEYPDLVLTDIHMPLINGLELIRQMRRLRSDTWVPIIILSAYTEEEDIVNGLEAGADDYMTKPINLKILKAKIQSLQHFINLQKINRQTTLSLSEAHQALEREQLLAKSLIDKILDRGEINGSSLQYWLCPSAQFSGDLIAATRTVGTKLYLMLADATGHGLAAALPTLLIARTFYAMSDKGYALPSILIEMNQIAKKYLTTGYFVATALYAIDFDHQTIEYWNGGLPTDLLLDDEGEIMHTLPSSNLAIGILNDDEFNAKTQLLHWDKPCELFGFTDGLTEAENSQGQFFGEERLLSILQSQSPGLRLDAVKNAVESHIQGGREQDDISLFSIRLSVSRKH